MNKPIFPLSFSNLSVQYNQFKLHPKIALDNVDIPFICESQRIVLTGDNGAGKTTLIKCLSGQLGNHATGNVYFPDGDTIPLNKIPEKINLGFVPQSPMDGIVPSLTIRENLLLPTISRLKKEKKTICLKTINKELEDWLTLIPSSADILNNLECDPLLSLSGGYQQLLCLCANLFNRPDILLLDEPTSKLSPNLKKSIWDLLASYVAAGLTIICASHDWDASLSIAHRQLSLKDGKVVSDSNPQGEDYRRHGEVVKLKKQLPKRLEQTQNDWWKPGYLFGDPYFEGDNSNEGYLQGNPLSREKRTEKEIGGVLSILSAFQIDISKPDMQILDCPCGFGRHSIQLAKKINGKVNGFDINDNFLRKARRDSENIGNLEFIEGNILNLQKDVNGKKFDAILNLYTSFGFFSDEENINMILNFADSLKDGGVILIHFDLNPRLAIRGIATEPAWRSIGEGGKLFVREIYCEEDQRLYGLWDVLFENGQNYSREYRIQLFSENKWEEVAQKANLSPSFFGNLSENFGNLNDDSKEIVIVLQKKSTS